MQHDLPRRIGAWGAAAVMVGVTIGSGIFASPGIIAQHVGDPAVILALWAVGGMLSLCGALTYAELATMYPRSGGVFVFLHEGIGPMAAFVFGWTYMLITKPAAAAGIVLVFANHLNLLLGVDWNPTVTTCATLALLTFINTIGVRLGTGVAVLLTGAKVAALLAIVAGGAALVVVAALGGSASQGCAYPLLGGVPFVEGAKDPAGAPFPPGDSNSGLPPAATFVLPLVALAPVMAQILWTYDGWSDVGSIAGEVREPQRSLPRVYVLGTLAITLLYLAVNAVYYAIIPVAEMRGSETVAPLVMRRLAGDAGGTLVTLMIVLSTLGASHAAIITGARVTFAQARAGLLFRWLGAVHPVYATPYASLWCQLLLSCLAMIFLKRFEALAGAFVFTMWIFYGLAAAAVFTLRRRSPDAHRPCRCWGYPWTPLVFIAAAAAMTGLAICNSPSETLPWVGLLLAGAPAYGLWKRRTSRSAAT